MSKMKKLLTISIILNIIFILLSGYLALEKGGLSYIKSKIGIEKPYWYWKNFEHWNIEKSMYEIMPNDSSEIVFVGNSLIYRCNWAELFSNPRIKNRGIEGDNTEGILARLSEITESKPEKIFINTGTNDLALKMPVSEIYINYEKIIDQILETTPATKIYIQNVLPINNSPGRSNDLIIELNKKLEELAFNKSLKYINLHDRFIDEEGNLKQELTIDGLHLNPKGYLLWKQLIENTVND